MQRWLSRYSAKSMHSNTAAPHPSPTGAPRIATAPFRKSYSFYAYSTFVFCTAVIHLTSVPKIVPHSIFG